MMRLNALALLFLALLPAICATHVKTGKIRTQAVIGKGNDRRRLLTEAVTLMPILEWEDLASDGVSVRDCLPHRIRLTGDIDQADYEKGVVLAFYHQDYAALGCPLPKAKKLLRDTYVFRKIKWVKFLKNGGVGLGTVYLPGVEVIPKVLFTIAAFVDDVVQVEEDPGKALVESARLDNVALTLDERMGTIDVVKGVADLVWNVKGEIGVCNFEFDRRDFEIIWEQRFRVEASVTFRANSPVTIPKVRDDDFFGPFPIPSLGFSFRIPFLGEINVGFAWKVGYEVDLAIGTPITLKFSGFYQTGQRVTAGIGRIDIEDLGSTGGGSDGEIIFTDPTVGAGVEVKGFAGIRPQLGTILDIPIPRLPSLESFAGGTLGLQLNFIYKVPPFEKVKQDAGRILSPACNDCHLVEGTLTFLGKELSVVSNAPGLGDRTDVIRQIFIENLMERHAHSLLPAHHLHLHRQHSHLGNRNQLRTKLFPARLLVNLGVRAPLLSASPWDRHPARSR